METQQVVQVQELKAERVQGELMAAEEPYRVSLKAERVQGPAEFVSVGALGAEAPLSSVFEMTINQRQTVTIDLVALQIVITLHGPAAGVAGLAQ